MKKPLIFNSDQEESGKIIEISSDEEGIEQTIISSDDDSIIVLDSESSPVQARAISSDEEISLPKPSGISLRSSKRKFVFDSETESDEEQPTSEDAQFTNDSPQESPSTHLELLQKLRIQDDERELLKIIK